MSKRWFGFCLGLMMLAGASAATAQELKTAVFAGGCFWCVEEAFDQVDGVVETTSGYTGGKVPNPTYEQVSADDTGHYEAVQVRYDPARVTYAKLLDTFWRNVDPFDADGQFCDKGHSYLSVVFVATPEEEKLAQETKEAVAKRFSQKVATEILPAKEFYMAEGYHQDYYKTNPVRYKFYKWNCGRAQRLEMIWGANKS
jgi:peptide-methionine (S)-S-oxide reductase